MAWLNLLIHFKSDGYKRFIACSQLSIDEIFGLKCFITGLELYNWSNILKVLTKQSMCTQIHSTQFSICVDT